MNLYDARGREIEPTLDVSQLERTIGYQDSQLATLAERLAELELAMEDQGWRQLVAGGQREFSRAGLADIMRLARLMYLKNPLIKQGVQTQARYVFGRGVHIAGRDPAVNEVIQDFLDDSKNQVELTSHQARTLKEIDLQVLGNLYFVFFVDRITGAVRLRTIPADEVQDIIACPDDGKEPWLYRRAWTQEAYNASTGAPEYLARQVYYPDWRYQPKVKPAAMYGFPVLWDQPVFHMRVGGLSDMKMGVPEVYAAIDWARAYKEFLEDWCTITRAYARFAWHMQTEGGQRGVTAAKTKFGTTLATGANQASIDRNPPPTVGSMFIGTGNQKMEPIKTAGATTKAEDGRRVLLMVAAAMGLPETFFGDASVGSLATAKSLDRPTELKMLDRQTLWAEALRQILDFVLDRAAEAPQGKLRGKTLVKHETEGALPLSGDPANAKPGGTVDRHVDVTFPALLEHDVAAQVAAIVQAATLGGKPLAGTMDLKTASKMLLTELGADQIDEILEMLFPEGEPLITGKPMNDEDRLAAGAQLAAAGKDGGGDNSDDQADDNKSDATESAAMMVSAVKDLREAIETFRVKYGGRQ